MTTELLTIKQRHILQFIERSQMKLGRAPRLVELTEHFKITNKPMLDFLRALQKKGHIEMTDGRVDTIKVSRPLHIEKEYDVFVSYSHTDEEKVQAIVYELEKNGFHVWMDKYKIFVGDSIIEKIYNDGLEKSRFFLIILSKASVTSPWVQEEINYIKLRDIQATNALIRPILLDDCEIPVPLQSLLYADFRTNFAKGMENLLKSFNVPPEPAPKAALQISNPAPDFSQNIIEYQQETATFDLNIESKAYKEWIIRPTNKVLIPLIPANYIRDLTDKARIRLTRYGGMPFPYDIPRGFKDEYCQAVNRQDGFMQYDCRPGPGDIKPLYYWRMNKDGLFVSRYSLREDELAYELGHKNYDNTLSWDWILMDIVRSLLFIKNLLVLVPDIISMQLDIKLNKMKDRQLIILNKSRAGFFSPYRSHESQIYLDSPAVITRETDLKQTAFNMAMYYARIFNWNNPNETQTLKDIQTLLNGEMPQ